MDSIGFDDLKRDNVIESKRLVPPSHKLVPSSKPANMQMKSVPFEVTANVVDDGGKYAGLTDTRHT